MALQALGALLRAVGFFALVAGLFYGFVELGTEGLKASLAAFAAGGAGAAAVFAGSYLKKLGGAPVEPPAPAPGAPAQEAAAAYGAHWGAFFLTWIWALGNGVWLPGALCLAYWVLSLYFRLGGILFVLPPMVLFAWKGHAWARAARPPADEASYRLIQLRWTRIGVAFFVVELLLGAWFMRREAQRKDELTAELNAMRIKSEAHEAWDKPENLARAQAQTKLELGEVRILGSKEDGWVIGGRVKNVGTTRSAPVWVDCEIRDGSGLAVFPSTASDIMALDPGDNEAVFCDWKNVHEDLPPDKLAYAAVRPFETAPSTAPVPPAAGPALSIAKVKLVGLPDTELDIFFTVANSGSSNAQDIAVECALLDKKGKAAKTMETKIGFLRAGGSEEFTCSFEKLSYPENAVFKPSVTLR